MRVHVIAAVIAAAAATTTDPGLVDHPIAATSHTSLDGTSLAEDCCAFDR